MPEGLRISLAEKIRNTLFPGAAAKAVCRIGFPGVGGKMILPPHGKQIFTRHSKEFFTYHGKEFFT